MPPGARGRAGRANFRGLPLRVWMAATPHCAQTYTFRFRRGRLRGRRSSGGREHCPQSPAAGSLSPSSTVPHCRQKLVFITIITASYAVVGLIIAYGVAVTLPVTGARVSVISRGKRGKRGDVCDGGSGG